MQKEINYSQIDTSKLRKRDIANIPEYLLRDDTIIKRISKTYNIHEFYFFLNEVADKIFEPFYLDEHSRFCDEEITKCEDGILPKYLERDYPDTLTLDIAKTIFSYNEFDVIKRIFARREDESLETRQVLRELSKYIIIGMLISRNFKTDPTNLLIDITTLYKFAKEHDRKLKGEALYQVLLEYESKTPEEIIEIYNRCKDLPLQEVFYDDWKNQERAFVDELNDSIYLPNREDEIDKNGVAYIDIDDLDVPLLVHNTGIPIHDKIAKEKLVKDISSGTHPLGYICMSLQDKDHTKFYDRFNCRTIKFIYGKLNPNRVGIVSHNDAYSLSPNEISTLNPGVARGLYTIESLLDQTSMFNEITYSISGGGSSPLYPIGVICIDTITEEEKDMAETLGVPILLRHSVSNQKKGPAYVVRHSYQYTRRKWPIFNESHKQK